MKTFEIKLKKGLGDISFGDAPEKVMAVLGQPQEVENLDMDDDNTTLITHYTDKEVALFFVNPQQKPMLECIESSNRDTVLFGKKLFLMNECEIIDLMKQNGYENAEIENEIWGEKRLTFEDAMIDFYFDDKQLSVISWGVMMGEV
jgi:hypothetical protein